jgi:Tfp pilus assembly protein PilF
MYLQGDVDAARRHVDILKERAPRDAEVLALEALMAAETGDRETALEKRQQSFTAEPTTGRMIALAHQKWLQDDREGALTLQREWLADNPQDIAARLQLANAYLLLEREDDAAREYQRVLEQDATNIRALNNLAWLHKNKDLDAALEFAERAYAQAPSSPEVLDTLAQLYLQSGQADRALRMAERALAENPESPTYRLRMAQSLTQLGQTDRALQMLEPLLAPGTDAPTRAAAQSLARELR